jgi:hypothetical protein
MTPREDVVGPVLDGHRTTQHLLHLMRSVEAAPKLQWHTLKVR